MTNTTRQTLVQRSTALALAAVVTLALLGGIDSLATHEFNASAWLAQEAATAVANS